MTALIDADAIIYIIGWHFKDSNDEEALLKECLSLFRELIDQTGATHYVGVFSDVSENTFRYKEYTQATYKGKRPDTPDWVSRWKGVIKGYFINEFKFTTAVGLEADDIVAALQTQLATSCICSPDKDLRQIPGYNFDYKKMTLQEIKPFDAWYNLYTQMLVGDTTDNVVGIPKIGPVKAVKILADCTSIEQMETAVKEQYDIYFKDEGEAIYQNTLNTIMMLRPEHYYWNAILPIIGITGEAYVNTFPIHPVIKRQDENESMWKDLGW